MEKTTSTKQNPLKVGLFTRLVLNIFPAYGLRRLQTQAHFNYLENNGFITPTSNKRSMRDWFPSFGSADRDTLKALPSSRGGSRDLYMNTPVATAILRRKSTNTIGAGLTLQSRVNRKFLGLSAQEANDWEQNTEREFNLWASKKECDASRNQNFFQLQGLIFLNKMLSGDVFVVMPHRKTKRSPYSLSIQVLEGDMCETPDHLIDGIATDKIRSGIELDSFGAPVKYYFRTKHPGDITIERNWVGIPAYGSRTGRKNVLHIFDKERPGQRRGMPALAPVMEKLKMISRLDESELMAAVISSFFTVFIKKSTQVTNGLAPSFDPSVSVKEDDNPQDHFNQELGPGMINVLDDDESIEIADPKRPNAAYEAFFNTIVKEIGAALEVPFELVMLTFNSSYSASRAAILEGWKTFKKERIAFVSEFNQPIYEEFLTEAIIRGRISAPGFLTDPALKHAWAKSFWAGPGMGQIDPKKETEGALMRINGRLSNHETESQDINGGDWDGSMARLSQETERLEELDLSIQPTLESIKEGNNGQED